MKSVTGVREELTRELLWGDEIVMQPGQPYPLGAIFKRV
jgi:hypothetical protein